jgi:hypothetical protein
MSQMAPCDFCGRTSHLRDGACAMCRAIHKLDVRAIDRERLLEVLANHIGAANGVTITQLAIECAGTVVRTESHETLAQQRHLRKLVEELRIEGHHICASPSRGYYMAETTDELEDTCAFLFTRAMTSLRQVSAMKRISLPDLAGQLNMRL